jgi:hypothetical protein
MTEPEITKRDIDKLFGGFKLYHFVVGMPAGFLIGYGLGQKNYIEWICGTLLLVGSILQTRFFFRAIRKIVDFIRQDLKTDQL